MARRHFHYVLAYKEETNEWYVETYEVGDGDIYDPDLDEWRWADDEVIPGEQDLDGKLYGILKMAVDKLPTPIITPAGQEPDLIYGNEA